MAFRAARYLGIFSQISKTRYYYPSSLSSSSSSSFSTLELNSNNSSNCKQLEKNNTNLDERFVLNELSDLLSINLKQPINYNEEKQIQKEEEEDSSKRVGVVVIDEFLTPADKLRGVFLQKLNGKAAIESALTDIHVDLTLEIVGEVVNKGNLGGEAMVDFFNWAIKQPAMPRDLRSYKVILKALGRRKYFDYMEKIRREMIKEEIKLDFETLEVVMDSFVRARLVSKAVQLFENLEEFGLKRETDSLNVLLMCLCRRSHVGTASSVLNSKKGKIDFDRITFNVIIGAWSKLGRIHEVERFIREMVDDGLSPDCSTFSYLLEGLGRAGQIDDAVEVFRKMSENECMPDTATYNVMISNFVSVGKLDECMKYYRDMTAKNSSPDMNTYTILISAFLKSRRVADALELFDEMLDRGIHPNTGIITSFLEPLCSFGPPHAATMIYKKARKVGCEISLKAYKLLLMRLSRFGKCGMVLKVWDEMQSCGYSSDMEVYEYVVNGLCNIGQLENAVLVMEEALSKGFCPGKIIYSKLNNKLLNVNKVERAYRLFLKVKEARRSENARRYWRANGWHF
ncbi:hypothetical protein AQUCO_01500332v1 [Aquilegia coerulea]|uniref:Pentacotripeptide-repeat region of PRORP domain-containing protein n=1 Tax=Aquilegia coerulea TaxID=218851 RepID=A0A2G5DT82_AQUCA|nr:hypothetical protein AQUCO_01500332v1 [Aquilegia coerulea]